MQRSMQWKRTKYQKSILVTVCLQAKNICFVNKHQIHQRTWQTRREHQGCLTSLSLALSRGMPGNMECHHQQYLKSAKDDLVASANKGLQFWHNTIHPSYTYPQHQLMKGRPQPLHVERTRHSVAVSFRLAPPDRLHGVLCCQSSLVCHQSDLKRSTRSTAQFISG